FYAAENRGVITWREADQDRRFLLFRWRQIGGSYVGLLRTLPIVVSCDPVAVGVTQIEKWILQDVWHIERSLAQRWTEYAYDHIFVGWPFYNDAGNQNLVPGLNETTSRDVAELTGAASVGIVALHQSNSSRVIHSAHNDGVIVGTERGENRTLCRIRRGKTRCGDLGRIGSSCPIVVRSNETAIARMQFKDWIRQSARQIEGCLSKGRPKRAQQHLLWRGAFDDNPPIMTLAPVPTKPRVEILPSKRGTVVSGA